LPNRLRPIREIALKRVFIRIGLFFALGHGSISVVLLVLVCFWQGQDALAADGGDSPQTWSEPWVVEEGEARAVLSDERTVTSPVKPDRLSLMQVVVLLPIKAYQKGNDNQDAGTCPFDISCSVFARRAVELFGAVQGSLMTADRLLRCNPSAYGQYPLNARGYLDDPVESNAPGHTLKSAQ